MHKLKVVGPTFSGSQPMDQSTPPVDLDERFEAEFARHLDEVNKLRKLKSSALGVLGAGLGGALGLAASPVLVPGVAVAALAGGAGGWSWALRKSEEHRKRHAASGSKHLTQAVRQERQRPTLRRLRYLVDWGYWQLHEYENATPECRGAVVCEVVRAFSPWVQRLFTLSVPLGGTAAQRASDAEAHQAATHLAPLYHWLQRRAAYEAVFEAIAAVAACVRRGDEDVSVAQMERHREMVYITLPTLLQCVSLVERMGEASSGQQPRRDELEVSAEKAKSRRWNRMQRMVAEARAIVERGDVAEAIGKRFRRKHVSDLERSEQVADTAPVAEGAPTEGGSPRGGDTPQSLASLVVPPEGVEDEVGGHLEGREGEYYSLSEESDHEEERLRSRARSNAGGGSVATEAGRGSGILPSGQAVGTSSSSSVAPRPPRAPATGADVACLDKRCKNFPRGDGVHMWSVAPDGCFMVRSESYLKDRRKQPAGPAVFELLHVDFLRIGSSGPARHPAEHPDMFPSAARKAGEKRFLLVQNWVFAPFQCVMVAAARDDAEAWAARAGPGPQAQLRAWERFLQMPVEEMRDCLKIIIGIDQGPWIVQRAVPKKPILVGRQIKVDARRQEGFLELTFDVAAGRTEQLATGLVMRAMSIIEMSMCVMIEGRSADELPEAPLMCAAMKRLNTADLFTPLEAELEEA